MICQVPECPVVAWKHGLCKEHWMANARNEPTGLPTPALPSWARAPEARQPAPAPRSYAKEAPPVSSPTKAVSPTPQARVLRQAAPAKPPPARCAVAGCDRRAVAKGKCDRHYRRDWEAARRKELPPPAPLTGAPLEPAALRLVWSCVPERGAQLHEVADACGLGLSATVTALHALETTYGYVTFDGARWHALIPCGRQQGERLWTPKT